MRRDGGTATAARLISPPTSQAFWCVVEHELLKSATQSPQFAFRRANDAIRAVLRTTGLFWFGTHLYPPVEPSHKASSLRTDRRRRVAAIH